jgi:DNA-binding XRE family transcriptional regulator
MAKRPKRTTTDALEIIHDLYFKGRPEMELLLEDARERLRVAMKFQEMRELQGLSQQQLADRVGTSRSVISRLESNA